jgi:hypothetical protein
MEPFARFFFALAGAGLLRDRDYEWDGKFGSSQCPACNATPYLWFTDVGGDFRFGCREKCDRAEILALLGLDGFDVLRVVPKWLRKSAR